MRLADMLPVPTIGSYHHSVQSHVNKPRISGSHQAGGRIGLRNPSLSELSMSLTTSIISTGTASTTVFDAFGPSPSMVWSVRSCMAPGLSPIVRAAARLIAAALSPSALVIVALFALGRGLPRHHLLQLLRHVDVLDPQACDFQPPSLGIMLDFDWPWAGPLGGGVAPPSKV